MIEVTYPSNLWFVTLPSYPAELRQVIRSQMPEGMERKIVPEDVTITMTEQQAETVNSRIQQVLAR